jgi:DNA polymerase III gamma/tau subunit
MSDYLWVEKYRPKTIEDCILSQDIKETFSQFLKQKEIPNLLLSGTAGTGKTTVAHNLKFTIWLKCNPILYFFISVYKVTNLL